MSFISFNENYYRKKIEKFESKPLTDNDIYELQQLLKLLDDLADEGYVNLNDHMERSFSCLTRLHSLLKKAGVSPIPVERKNFSSVSYRSEDFELNEILDSLMAEAKEAQAASNDPFINEIYRYSRWIGHEEGTAYVFLLRDTLLPYIYFKSRWDKGLYPWLIGRRFLEQMTGVGNVDDDIRLPIYEALESGNVAFENFCAFYKDRVRAVLDNYSKLKQIILKMFASIKESKIIVIESGYIGTIPMMLKAVDERVSFKLYTTAPFLYETYKDIIFCRRYEDIRNFETLYSQDLLFQYSSYHDEKFYVKLSDEKFVTERSLGEIKNFIY